MIGSNKKVVICLNENPVPEEFTKGTIAAKETRLRAAINEIDEVHIIARKGPYIHSHHQDKTPIEEKIIVHLLPPWPYYLATIPLIIWGYYYTKKLNPITIESESPILSGPAAVIVGKLTNTTSVVEIRTTFTEMIKHRLKTAPLDIKRSLVDFVQSNTLKHASAIIVNSRTYQQILSKTGVKSTVINPGLQYPPPKPTPIPQRKLPLTIGYLGRLVPEKGLDLLLEAVNLLSQDQNVPDFRVEIAGNGSQKKALELYVAENQLEPYVTFLGQVHNFTVLNHWHILVNPCLVNAPLEMVNVEAAYMEIPVICFGNAKYPETVSHNRTGIKVKHKSSSALASAIKHLLIQPDQIQKLGQAGPKFAHRYFGFESQVKKLTRFYQNLGLLT